MPSYCTPKHPATRFHSHLVTCLCKAVDYRCLCLCRHLMLDSATMQGLNIFSEERHPSHMGIGSTKEGFSLFGMLNKCITNMVGNTRTYVHAHIHAPSVQAQAQAQACCCCAYCKLLQVNQLSSDDDSQQSTC